MIYPVDREQWRATGVKNSRRRYPVNQFPARH